MTNILKVENRMITLRGQQVILDSFNLPCSFLAP